MSQKKLLEERIIELYNQGLSLQKVANFVGYKSANSVKNILIKYGIQTRGTAGFKEPFKENFFENIDSEEKAYFLGFLMADGNVYVRKQSQPCIRLEISVKDLEILERFKMAIESKNSICFDKRNCCSLKVHSCKIYEIKPSGFTKFVDNITQNQTKCQSRTCCQKHPPHQHCDSFHHNLSRFDKIYKFTIIGCKIIRSEEHTSELQSRQ